MTALLKKAKFWASGCQKNLTPRILKLSFGGAPAPLPPWPAAAKVATVGKKAEKRRKKKKKKKKKLMIDPMGWGGLEVAEVAKI